MTPSRPTTGDSLAQNGGLPARTRSVRHMEQLSARSEKTSDWGVHSLLALTYVKPHGSAWLCLHELRAGH